MTLPGRISGGILVLPGFIVLLGAMQAREASTVASGQDDRPFLRYDTDYPGVNYTGTPLLDPVARLQARIESGETELAYEEGRGYLASVLRELGIDVRSQTLVFSRTSAQIPFISPETPRALYYSDDVYVGWPPNAPEIEVASMDPNVGPVFYTLSQDRASEVRFERRLGECLRCHDSYSLTGGGVPRFIVGSGYTDGGGEQVSHEGWILVDDRTPFRFRWGGWYVTGTHGAATHMGNWIIRDPEELNDIDLTRTGNVTDLSTLIDTERYLGRHSDIAALMVLDHQTRVQNVLTRVNYETRTLLEEREGDATAESGSEATLEAIGTIAEPLVEALLMVGQPPLSDPVRGTSGFAEAFADPGPFDRAGRSLRQLDLANRLFRYSASYLIYSDAFDALPLPARQYVYRRLTAILSPEDSSETFAHISAEEKAAILEILLETKPEFRALG